MTDIKEVEALKKEIDRLSEENDNIKMLEKSHKELNGKLQTRLREVEEDNKKLALQISDLTGNRRYHEGF
jgi:regulator of replication initiation timing|tara:strand:- start:742 stop:951 length:210 start_codon:yes stop_codon:yes gene_type:complete